jgi:hypothetical protein
LKRVKTMSDLPGDLERLATRLSALERRVDALEHPSEAFSPTAAPPPAAQPAAQAVDSSSQGQAGSLFPVLGKALLGIAGAYVLRAVAESSSLPKLGIATVALVYAFLWLVGATRVRTGKWLASTIYACTSALILAPMLWELTLRFKVLPAAGAAGVLCGFAVGASALAWKRDLASVFWVANGASALMALALTLATHEMAPFVAALLLMAVVCELAAWRNHALSVRPLVAAAADLAIWALIFIYSGPPGTRADYSTLATPIVLSFGFILFLIYAVSVALKTTLHQQGITAFETVQCMVALLLAASGLLFFEPSGGAAVLGVLCLLLSGTTYAAAFTLFDRARDPHNYRVFAIWSVALFLAGSLLSLSPLGRAVGLSVAAIMATVLGVRLKRLTLEFHGLVYLLAAAVVCGLPEYVLRSLAGTLPGAPGWGVSLVSACAVLCYAGERPEPAEGWEQQLLRLVSGSLALAGAAALLVEGLAWLTALGINLGAHHLAFIRTSILCGAALALAYSGAHWRRMELTRIGYATLVLAAVKLLFEDLRNGHLEFIAASIFLFALTLIAVPWLARRGQRAKEPAPTL